MPSNLVDTPKEEKMWKKAKQKVKKQKDKNYNDFTDQDWGLVNHIFQNMKESKGDVSCDNPNCDCDPCICKPICDCGHDKPVSAGVNIPVDEVLEAISKTNDYDSILKNVVAVGAKYFSRQDDCAEWATEWCIENDSLIAEKIGEGEQIKSEEYNPLEPLVGDENYDSVRDFLCSLDYLTVDEMELVLNNEKSPELALLPSDAEKVRELDKSESHYSDPFIWQHDLPFVLMGELNKNFKSKGLGLRIKSQNRKPND